MDLLGLKVQKIQNAVKKKSSIMKSGHFIITYLAQIDQLYGSGASQNSLCIDRNIQFIRQM